MKRLALLVIALAACFAQDQTQEPTYEKTQKWIVAKLSEGGYTRVSKITRETSSYDKISMDDCRLLYTETEFYSISSEVPSGTLTSETTTKSEVAIPLDKVGASDIAVKHDVNRPLGRDEWSVNINSRVGTIKMIETERGVVGEKIKNYSNLGAEIIFGRSPTTDEDTANRVKKALSHAVDLCKKMKEKEPF